MIPTPRILLAYGVLVLGTALSLSNLCLAGNSHYDAPGAVPPETVSDLHGMVLNEPVQPKPPTKLFGNVSAAQASKEEEPREKSGVLDGMVIVSKNCNRMPHFCNFAVGKVYEPAPDFNQIMSGLGAVINTMNAIDSMVGGFGGYGGGGGGGGGGGYS